MVMIMMVIMVMVIMKEKTVEEDEVHGCGDDGPRYCSSCPLPKPETNGLKIVLRRE